MEKRGWKIAFFVLLIVSVVGGNFVFWWQNQSVARMASMTMELQGIISNQGQQIRDLEDEIKKLKEEREKITTSERQILESELTSWKSLLEKLGYSPKMNENPDTGFYGYAVIYQTKFFGYLYDFRAGKQEHVSIYLKLFVGDRGSAQKFELPDFENVTYFEISFETWEMAKEWTSWSWAVWWEGQPAPV